MFSACNSIDHMGQIPHLCRVSVTEAGNDHLESAQIGRSYGGEGLYFDLLYH